MTIGGLTLVACMHPVAYMQPYRFGSGRVDRRRSTHVLLRSRHASERRAAPPGQPDPERRAGAGPGARRADGAAVQLDELTDDAEAEPEAAVPVDADRV